VGDFLLTLLAGVAGGFAGGLLGVGGGAVYVPALVILLDEDQHLAQGASLAAIVATGLVGGITHMRQGNVHIRAVLQVTPVAVAAGFAAAFAADVLEATVLRRVFSIVVLYFAGTMIWGALRRPAAEEQGG
jgi:uncharacterized membrane protein YfcA